ncbi:MAG: RNA-binding domain-containing protein [Candidatus Odinarchaeota archaeon]
MEREPSNITVHALVQATEDEAKVKTAVQNLFPQEIGDSLSFKQTKLRGYYHNPIIHLETRLTQRVAVKETLYSIGQRLPPEERAKLAITFENRVDQKGQLFLRFDKQESYQGQLRLVNRGDSLRLVVRFSGRKPQLSELQKQCHKFNLI